MSKSKINKYLAKWRALPGGAATTTPERKWGDPPARTPHLPPLRPRPAFSLYRKSKYPAPPELDSDLARILSTYRDHNSASERAFSAALRQQLIDAGHTVRDHVLDQFSVTVPLAGGTAPDILFACHLDTVDSTDSPAPKALDYNPDTGHVALAKTSQNIGTVLGADDGAGVWLLLQMIAARVPGTYLFHRGEERGGQGAKAMATQESVWLGQFQIAVEFDRKDTCDIVTHQRGGTRCASDKFAAALSKALEPLKLKQSRGGTYTDVAEYSRLIPECVNLSIGYNSAHSDAETLDVGYLYALRDQLIALNWITLPVDRDVNWIPDPSLLYAVRRMTDAEIKTWADTATPAKIAAILLAVRGEEPYVPTIYNANHQYTLLEDALHF